VCLLGCFYSGSETGIKNKYTWPRENTTDKLPLFKFDPSTYPTPPIIYRPNPHAHPLPPMIFISALSLPPIIFYPKRKLKLYPIYQTNSDDSDIDQKSVLIYLVRVGIAFDLWINLDRHPSLSIFIHAHQFWKSICIKKKCTQCICKILECKVSLSWGSMVLGIEVSFDDLT
jgi:hypothetical protein